jgi:hypothetical protein
VEKSATNAIDSWNKASGKLAASRKTQAYWKDECLAWIKWTRELRAALQKIADPGMQLPWRACAKIAREVLFDGNEKSNSLDVCECGDYRKQNSELRSVLEECRLYITHDSDMGITTEIITQKIDRVVALSREEK